MRIALFCETYLPHLNGVVTHVKTLKDGLEALGHQVLVITADYTAKKHYVQAGVLHCPAIRAKRFYNYGLAKPVSMTRYKLVKQFAPDIIHIHDEYGISLSGISIAKQLHIPLVYTLHTMYDQYLYYISPKLLLPFTKKVAHRYSKFIAGKANAITGPSPKCQNYLQSVGIKAPVTVIPNAVELEMFACLPESPATSAELRNQLGLANQAVFCFVGRLGKEKSVDVLLDYMAQTLTMQDKIHLLVIGSGPVSDELIQQAKTLNIADMVTFAGSVPHDALAPYLHSCKAYVTASLSEMNSISTKEAMASGLPVLYRYDAVNEGQVQDGINGFVYYDAPGLADGMRKMRDMPEEEYQQLCQSTIRSMDCFSQTALAQRLLDIYQSVLKK